MISTKLLTLIRLAIINATGFAASTVVPLWIGGIAKHLNVAEWFAGIATTSQLVAAAILNLATPTVFSKIPPLKLARIALLVAASASLLQQVHHPAVFVVACMICGGALGTVLNCTNRILAGVEKIQQSYSVYQIIEVCFAVLLFSTSAAVMVRLSLPSIFLVVAVFCLVGNLLLRNLPIESLVTQRISATRSTKNHVSGALALAALTIFFVGQSSINSYMIPIGQSAGLTTETISRIIALSMVFGFSGAVLSRVIGERFGMVVPVVTVAILLIFVFAGVTNQASISVFALCSGVLACCTIFVVPYFFTYLAKLDRGGLYASIAPAFLLCGVAIGPSIAVFITLNFDISTLGILASIIVAFATIVFSLCVLHSTRLGTEEYV